MSYTNLTSHRSDVPARMRRFRATFDEPHAMLRLAVPIMLIALVNMGMSITDTVMVSASYGTEALASVAVGSDFYSILFYLGAGTIGGLLPFYVAPLPAPISLSVQGWSELAWSSCFCWQQS
jgi:hypothetical protein